MHVWAHVEVRGRLELVPSFCRYPGFRMELGPQACTASALKAQLIYFLSLRVFPLWTFHIHGIISYVVFYKWLLLLSMFSGPSLLYFRLPFALRFYLFHFGDKVSR